MSTYHLVSVGVVTREVQKWVEIKFTEAATITNLTFHFFISLSSTTRSRLFIISKHVPIRFSIASPVGPLARFLSFIQYINRIYEYTVSRSGEKKEKTIRLHLNNTAMRLDTEGCRSWTVKTTSTSWLMKATHASRHSPSQYFLYLDWNLNSPNVMWIKRWEWLCALEPYRSVRFDIFRNAGPLNCRHQYRVRFWWHA